MIYFKQKELKKFKHKQMVKHVSMKHEFKKNQKMMKMTIVDMI